MWKKHNKHKHKQRQGPSWVAHTREWNLRSSSCVAAEVEWAIHARIAGGAEAGETGRLWWDKKHRLKELWLEEFDAILVNSKVFLDVRLCVRPVWMLNVTVEWHVTVMRFYFEFFTSTISFNDWLKVLSKVNINLDKLNWNFRLRFPSNLSNKIQIEFLCKIYINFLNMFFSLLEFKLKNPVEIYINTNRDLFAIITIYCDINTVRWVVIQSDSKSTNKKKLHYEYKRDIHNMRLSWDLSADMNECSMQQQRIGNNRKALRFFLLVFLPLRGEKKKHTHSPRPFFKGMQQSAEEVWDKENNVNFIGLFCSADCIKMQK